MKHIVHLISNIILVILLVMVALLLIPNLLGMKSYVVLSGSMEPSYPTGSLILTSHVDANMIQEGDVISFQLDDIVVTHRVVEAKEGNQEFVMKGDANNTNDKKTVSYGQVLGLVHYSIPFLGYVMAHLTSPMGKILILCFIAILLVSTVIDKLYSKKEKEWKRSNTEQKMKREK